METMTKTNHKEKEALRQLQSALKRSFMGFEFLTCDIKDLEKAVKEKSRNAAPR